MTKSRTNQVDAEPVMSETEKVWAGQKDRLLDWNEEVSHFSTSPYPFGYKFTLYAFGTGDRQVLTILEDDQPEARLDISMDRNGIEKLAHWGLESVGLLVKPREKILEIADATKKSKRARLEMDKLLNREAEVSRIKIYHADRKCKFKLRACGDETVPVSLTISFQCDAERKMQVVWIERDDIARFAEWLIDCLFLLDWLKKKKEAEITDALRKRRAIMLRCRYKFVARVV